MAKRIVLNSTDPVAEACIALANQLILGCKLHVPKAVSLKDIDSQLIVLLFESLCGSTPPDQFSVTDSIDEAHNVQAVIDALSLDILSISLSHITGEDIVARNPNSIFNLLEVFRGILLFISPEIGISHSSSSGESTNQSKKLYQLPESQHLDKTSSSAENLTVVLPKEITNQRINPEFARIDIQNEDSSHIHIQQTSKEGNVFPSDTIFFKSNDKPQTALFSNSLKKEPGKIFIYPSKATESRKHFIISQSTEDRFDGLSKNSARSNQVKITVRPPPKRIIRKRKALKVVLSDEFEAPSNKEIEVLPGPSEGKEVKYQTPVEKTQFRIVLDKNIGYNNLGAKRKPVGEPFSKRFTSKRNAIKPSSDKVKIPGNQIVETKYKENLENKMKTFLDQHASYKHGASQLKRSYMNAIKRPLHKTISPFCKKSFLLPSNLRKRGQSIPSTSPKKLHFNRQSFKPVASIGRKDETRSRPEHSALIKKLQDDFPHVDLSPHTVRCMDDKNERHLMTMHKQVKTSLLKKPRTQVQLEEASKRQEVLSNIMKNEQRHNQYLKRLEEEKLTERKVGYSLRDARLRSARTSKYFKEYHENMCKKMQTRNIAEEQLIKRVHDEAMNIEKEQVLILCKRSKELDEQDAAQNRNYLGALENFYDTQFAMLSESLATEKRDIKERIKAQKRALKRMERDMRKKLESEVADIQQQVVDSTREIHFRELDAERYLEDQRDKHSAVNR